MSFYCYSMQFQNLNSYFPKTMPKVWDFGLKCKIKFCKLHISIDFFYPLQHRQDWRSRLVGNSDG